MSSRDPGVFHLVSSTGQLGLWSPAQASQRNGGGGAESALRGLCQGQMGLQCCPCPFSPCPQLLISCRGITAPPGAAPGTGDLLCRWLRSGGIGGIHDIIHDQVCMSLKQSFPERYVYQLV